MTDDFLMNDIGGVSMNWPQNMLVLFCILFFAFMTEYVFGDIKKYLRGKEHPWVTPRVNDKLMAIEATVFAITTMVPIFFTVQSLWLLISIPVVIGNWGCHFMLRHIRKLKKSAFYMCNMFQALITWGVYFLMIL